MDLMLCRNRENVRDRRSLIVGALLVLFVRLFLSLGNMRAAFFALALLALLSLGYAQKYHLWHWKDSICDSESGSSGQAVSDGECFPIGAWSTYNNVGSLVQLGYAKVTASTYYGDCDSTCTTCNFTGPVVLNTCTALVAYRNVYQWTRADLSFSLGFYTSDYCGNTENKSDRFDRISS